jgi:hypothetical protein
MDRRAFSFSFASLSLASATLAAAQNTPSSENGGEPILASSTFSHVGKEEQPFRETREAVLAENEGPGYLDHMWFGGDFPNYKRLRLRIYVDGETRASIDMELGLGAGVGFADPAAPWGTKFSGITGSPSGIFLNYQVPFTSKVRVTAELPPGAPRDTVFWWIVRGLKNYPVEISGIRLPRSARLKLTAKRDYRVEPLEEFDLCKVTGSGMIFMVTMAAQSTRFDFLEAQMRAYIGTGSELQYLSSGLEDYFLGTYYFNRGPYQLSQAGLTHKDEVNHSFSAYRFHDIDPIVFSGGIRLTCRCGEKRGDKVFGPTGHPMPTTYTTYVWTYEWE